MGQKGKSTEVANPENEQQLFTQAEGDLADAIFQNADTLIVVLDKHGRIKKFNRAAERLSGYRFSEIKNKYPWRTFLPTEESETVRKEAFEKLINNPDLKIGRYSNLWQSKNGKQYLTEWSNSLLLDDQGQVEFIVAIGSDITERKLAEQALIESEKRFWTLFDNAPEAIVVLDADQQHRFVDANQNACQLFKMSREELLQKSPIDVSPPVQPDGRRSTQAAIEVIQLALAGNTQHFEWTHQDATGTDIACEVYLVRLPSSSGRNLLRGSVVDIRSRKRTEEALRESEERMELVIQGAEVATWDWNLQTEKVVFNKRWSEMLGYTEKELAFHPSTWEQRVHPDDKQRVRELADLHLQGTTNIYESEYRMQHKSGEWIWVLDRGKVTERDPQGKALRLCGTHLDITERKRAENDLYRSEKLYRALIEASPDVVVVADSSGQITFASSHIVDLLGLNSLDSFIGSSVLQWVVEEDRERAATNIKKRLAGEELPISEYRLLKESGEVFYAEINSSVLMDESSQASGMVAFVRDISERKNAKMRQADLASIVEESLNEIYIIDQETLRFISVNRSARDNMGYSLEELLKLTALDIKPEITSEAFNQLIEPLHSGKSKKIVFETVHLRKNGSRYPVEVHLQNGTYADNAVYVAMINDISDRKQAEEQRLNLERQMQHAQKLESLGVLAGGIAHDFNNILTSILGFSDLALMQLESNSTAAAYIKHVVEGGQKAAELAQQMLAYSGKGRFDIQALDLSQLVQDMAGLLDLSISKKCLLRYVFASELPSFEADATQIRQVVMNLVINASDAIGDQNGIITVRTGEMECDKAYLEDSYLDDDLENGPYVFLEVSDTGEGMSESDRQKIFDPFFTTKFTGRGLGLAAVLGIVRGHQGAIVVQSEPGKGSSFKVFFPVSRKLTVDREDTPPDAESTWLAQGTVLLIDDEEPVRRSVQQMLETMGFVVLVAENGEEGLKQYRQQVDTIELVIVDMTMPVLDGEKTFHEIRNLRKDAKVILTSGYDEQSGAKRYTAQGLAGFIQKPFRYGDLVSVIRKVLGE